MPRISRTAVDSKLKLALLPLLAFACGRPTAPLDASVDLTTSSSLVRADSAITITTTIRNVSSNGTFSVDPPQGCALWFEVTSTSTIVGPGEPVCPLVGYDRVQLGPDDSISKTTVWSGWSFAGVALGDNPHRLPQGSYEVRPCVRTSLGRVCGDGISIVIE